MKKRTMLVLLSALCTLLLSAQSADTQDFSRLALKSKPSLNGLEASSWEKLNLTVRLTGTDKIGLEEERVKTRCESLLKQAGVEPVYSSSQFESLLVSIHIVGEAFAVRLQFLRGVVFPVMPKGQETTYFMLAPTWEVLGAGTHNGDPDHILQGLDQQLTFFLQEYKKANTK
jgi:hypothetical protein